MLRRLLLPVVPCVVMAADFNSKDRQPTPDELARIPAVASKAKADALARDVRVADGFEFSIFATPPAVNYPVFVAASTDGTVYVSSDGNGSLDRKPHLGRVLRVRDTNRDGQADEVRAFVPDIDSPRGLVWDHDRLYLLHPPDVSVFFDRDGDGVAEERKTLVKGIGWTFKDRPADHASNGLSLGMDGWLYAAIGDFGFMEAVGADGRKLQLRGGGVVRFRPDGSGLEVWADGTRNILEVAVGPELEGIARDNTNDGGGWDIRLHHFSGRTQHGYPRLFKNFNDEVIQPLADYGGGSGCGAAWIDEPGFPAAWNDAPFTADWGREVVFHHGLQPKGATFQASQQEFLRLPRVTDLDADGNSAVYAASWKGASFTWVGPEVGFLVRVTPKGFQPEPMPAWESLDAQGLVAQLASPSARRRLEAQRTLLRRGLATKATPTLQSMARDARQPLHGRIAALFALALAHPPSTPAFLGKLSEDPSVAPWALRALGDLPDPSKAPAKKVVAALASQDPVARREAAIALARLQLAQHARALFPLLADADPVVAHTAVQSVVALQPVKEAFAALDAAKTSEAVRRGLLRALQSWHRDDVVDGLVQRLGRQPDAAHRQGLITALCRLHHVDGPWKGDSWGTRPDTRGPYYQPETWAASPRILAALQAAIENAGPDESAFLGRELSRHRIQSVAAVRKLLALAERDASLLPSVAAQLASEESLPPEAVPLLARAATLDGVPDAARAQAVQALARTDKPDAWRAVLSGLPRVLATKSENQQAEKARNAFLNSPHLDARVDVLAEAAERVAGEPSLWAEAALLKVAGRKAGSPEARALASRSLDAGWTRTARRVQVLKAAALAGDTTRATQFVAALADADPAVAAAAKATVQRLKIDPARVAVEAGQAKVGSLPAEAAMDAAVASKGDAARGEQLFAQVGCNGCHTVRQDEPLKGPYLGHIAKTYKRRELAEAILLPNKTLAQGFVTQHIELKDGTELDAFVVQEAADAVTVRTVSAQEQRIPLAQVARREKLPRSLMPEGLVAELPVRDLASILDYLEALARQAP